VPLAARRDADQSEPYQQLCNARVFFKSTFEIREEARAIDVLRHDAESIDIRARTRDAEAVRAKREDACASLARRMLRHAVLDRQITNPLLHDVVQRAEHALALLGLGVVLVQVVGVQHRVETDCLLFVERARRCQRDRIRDAIPASTATHSAHSGAGNVRRHSLHSKSETAKALKALEVSCYRLVSDFALVMGMVRLEETK
jgi:hypothetical protein